MNIEPLRKENFYLTRLQMEKIGSLFPGFHKQHLGSMTERRMNGFLDKEVAMKLNSQLPQKRQTPYSQHSLV
jgi:hypothetical protein